MARAGFPSRGWRRAPGTSGSGRGATTRPTRSSSSSSTRRSCRWSGSGCGRRSDWRWANGEWGRRSMRIRSYRELGAWKRGMAVGRMVYELTRSFPSEESFWVATQVRGAAICVPEDIAEGWGRPNREDYMQFLRIARGSRYELETLLLLAQEVGLTTAAEAEPIRPELATFARQRQTLYRRLSSRPG